MSELPFGLSADPFALPATLSAEQTARLIEMRVRACGGDPGVLFPAETCAEIHRHTHGVTGAVCDLAGRAMRHAAEAGAASVSAEHVRAAAGPEVVAPDGAAGEVASSDDAVREVAAPDVAVQEVAASDVAEPEPAPVAVGPDDDIPDLPAVPQGGFALPSEPSKDLAPSAQAWVSRFISPEGSGAAPAAPAAPARTAPAAPTHTAPPARPPVAKGPAVPAPYALPKIPVERRRAAVSPLPPDSHHPERRAVVGFAKGKPRERSRGPRGKAVAYAAAAAAAIAVVSLGAVLVHRLRAGLTPPQSSRDALIVPAPATGVIPVTPSRDSVRTAAPASPDPRAAASVASRSRVAVSTRPLATPAAPARHKFDTAPAPEPRASAPPERNTKLDLEIAAYIFLDRAETERERLVAAGHRARVVTEWENGAPTYRVVLGPFVSRAAAERAADELLGSGLVQQARVVTNTGDR